MSSLETVESIVAALEASMLLIDRSVASFREVGAGVDMQQNIGLLASALGDVSSVLHSLYESRPELMPAFLKIYPPSEANEALDKAITCSRSMVNCGQYNKAIGYLEECVRTSLVHHPDDQLEIIRAEINRLKSMRSHRAALVQQLGLERMGSL